MNPPWQIFKPVPNAEAIAAGLKTIPCHWSLTPLQEKTPRRKGWQTEDSIPHQTIGNLILNGEEAISKQTGKSYRRYWSGFGLRLGEASGGVVAIDVDGASAQPILEAISSGNIPNTVSWSSGKPGRYQMLFQIPESRRARLRNFTRAVITKWNSLATLKDEDGKPVELLEFRYNRCQSALPPSRHPSTSCYRWINSPANNEVAPAPDWLCNLLEELADREQQNEEARFESKLEREKLVKESTERRKALGIVGSVDLFDCFAQSVARLSPEEIFNWSGHDFKYRGREWFGCCPQHQSQSGESFTVRPDSLDWHCFGCGTGGGVAEYRHFVKGGKGSPKGKDFFEITKQLAEQARIELPKPENAGFEEPDPDEYAAYLQQEEQQLAVELAQDKERLHEFKQNYPERAKVAWRKAKRFRADILKATQWFEADLPPENSMFFGKGGLGAGKTTQLGKWVKQWKQQGKGFLCLGYRNSLLIQLCSEKKLGFYHLHESDAAVMQRDPSSGIALCVDSLWRFKPEDFEGKVVIIDEVMSVIRHLLHSPTVKGRDNILDLFQEALQRASQVICLDGCLADWAVKYLHALAPEKKIITLDNTYQGDKPLVNFLLGTVDIEEEVRKNDRSPWLHYLLNESLVPAICADSQVFAESLDNLLTEKGLRVLRVDSKTVPEEYVKEFLKDCDLYIGQHQPDVLIYTPSAESGVDVSIKGYFTHHFAFFFGVLGVDAILQMLGRIRDAQCTKFVWVREWVAHSEATHSKSPFTKSVGKAIEQMLSQDITDTVSGIDRDQDIIAKLWALIQQSKNPHFEASNQIQAIGNYEKSNLRECVLESLEASGYKIRQWTLNPSEEARLTVKGATEATKRQNCHDIFTAEKIAAELVEDLSKKFDARWEDRVKIIQATYRSRLPGIDETESWSEEFIYKIRYDNPDFINTAELFWLFSHPEVALRMNQERYHRLAQKEQIFIGNIRCRMAKIKALQDIGIEPFLNPENSWHEDSPELKQLITRCKDEKIAAALGKHPGQQTNIRFLGSLLKMLGLKHTGQKVKSANGDYRVYRLDRDTLSDPDRRNALVCLDQRWQNYLTQDVEILDWNQVLCPQTEADFESISANPTQEAQTPSQQASESVPRTPTEHIYINSPSWNQLESQVVSEVLGDVVVPVEELVEAFEFCETPADFTAVIEGYSPEQIDDAIALAPDQPRRLELMRWYQHLEVEPSEDEASAAGQQLAKFEESQVSTFNLQPSTGSEPEREPIKVGQRVWTWIAAFRKWGQGVVSAVLPGVSWDVRLEGECLDTLKVYQSAWIEPIVPQAAT